MLVSAWIFLCETNWEVLVVVRLVALAYLVWLHGSIEEHDLACYMPFPWLKSSLSKFIGSSALDKFYNYGTMLFCVSWSFTCYFPLQLTEIFTESSKFFSSNCKELKEIAVSWYCIHVNVVVFVHLLSRCARQSSSILIG